ncbi:iron chelate uptake ABC transporter family permease subunit [Marinomonas mediterranea]|uniref:Fe(3+)-siderophore ABC transporter permease n=1 Tax=Marinomonas mediterranea TaxID=119864 RepID=UPI00234BF9B2|nr:Fe(3+)-siderophore ABC transporter permease [Marinomonas mediterranea]WCN14067.1 iron chelate uptake ABC transporter family permease subunit [Marinomonas mediterranea]
MQASDSSLANSVRIQGHVSLTRKKRLFWLTASIAVLLIAMVVSLAIGSRPISVSTIIQILQGRDLGLDSAIIWEGRIPRTLNGLFVGMALGVSGALIQAITRNPLADPGILGVNVGASLAIAIGIVFLGVTTLWEFFIFSSVGALVTSLLVYAIGQTKGRPDPLKLTLAGVAIGAVLGGISSGLTLFNPNAFDAVRFWVVGSLDARTLDIPLFIAPVVTLGCLGAFALTPSLNAMGLGEALASTLGTHIVKVQAASLVIITLLCGCATAAAGPIGFVSLMMPHIARWMVGPDQRWIIPFCCLLTPILLLFSDIVGRVILTSELQVSVVTAFVGAPILIYLARKKGASQL